MDIQALPLGFGMALIQNEPAMRHFESMTEAEKEKVLAEAHGVRSAEGMQTLAARLALGVPYREELR